MDTERWAREVLPNEEPQWDPNTEEGRNRRERFCLAFLQGFRAGAAH